MQGLEAFKEQVCAERALIKIQRSVEMKALAYLMLGVLMVLSIIAGLDGSDGDWMENGIYIPWFVLFIQGFGALERPVCTIVEQGKEGNVFKKYLFAPVSVQRIFAIRLYIMTVTLLKIVVPSQMIACAAYLLTGRSLLDARAATFVPLIVGGICYLIYTAYLWMKYHQAKKQ